MKGIWLKLMHNDNTFEHLLFTIYNKCFYSEYMVDVNVKKFKILLSETYIVAPNTPIDVKFYLVFLDNNRFRLEFNDEWFEFDSNIDYNEFVKLVEAKLYDKFNHNYARDYFVYVMKYIYE